MRDPKKLVALTDRRLKKATPKQLYEALHGRLTDHHRFLLKLHLQQIDTLEGPWPRSTAKPRRVLSVLTNKSRPKLGFVA